MRKGSSSSLTQAAKVSRTASLALPRPAEQMRYMLPNAIPPLSLERMKPPATLPGQGVALSAPGHKANPLWDLVATKAPPEVLLAVSLASAAAEHHPWPKAQLLSRLEFSLARLRSCPRNAITSVPTSMSASLRGWPPDPLQVTSAQVSFAVLLDLLAPAPLDRERNGKSSAHRSQSASLCRGLDIQGASFPNVRILAAARQDRERSGRSSVRRSQCAR